MMATKTTKSDTSRKRARREEADGKTGKKRPQAQLEANGDEEVKILEEQVLESRKHYNNITILLEQARGGDALRSSQAQAALCRIFCHLLASGALQKESGAAKNDAIVGKWLADRLSDVWTVVTARLKEMPLDDQKLRMRLLMQMLKEEGLSSPASVMDVMKERGNPIFTALAADSVEGQIREFFLASFAEKHVDVAFALAYGIQQALTDDAIIESIDVSIQVLEVLGEAKPQAYWTQNQSKSQPGNDAITQKSLTKAIGSGWLIVLSKELSKAQRKTLLRVIPKRIAPNLQRPERLLDFLVDSFETGGSTALLALSGLFELIQKKNLDYPDFYRKVYSMLDSSILHSKHRSTFLRLLDTFLASTHLPAALVASFLKRLARLCLFAPPAAIAFIVPLTYNLLKAHPACTFMIHRELPKGTSVDGTDTFDMNEKDPMQTGALESSLWELHTLESHYHPNVAIIARIISEEFTKPAFNLEDFLDHSYASMLEADLVKPIKKEPAIEYQIPKIIFPRRTREQPTTYENVLELWAFDG